MLAIVLSTLVIAMFSKKEAQRRLEQQKAVQQSQITEGEKPTPSTEGQETTVTSESETVSISAVATETVASPTPEDFVFGEEKTVKVRSLLYDVVFDTRGARFTRVVRHRHYTAEPCALPTIEQMFRMGKAGAAEMWMFAASDGGDEERLRWNGGASVHRLAWLRGPA